MMKKENTKINLIQNPETLAALHTHTHTHTHTCSFKSKITGAIIASINNVKKDEKF